MRKRLFALVIAATLVFSMAGCGAAAPAQSESSAAESVEPEVTEEPEEPVEEATEEDGQNPVMNFIGVYNTSDSTEALVEADGMENAKITVTYAGNPWFHKQTVMSGAFDVDTLTMEFSDAAQTEYTYNSDGSVREEKPGYKGGKGKAVFTADNTLTITENFPTGDVETVFNWGPSTSMKTVTDPDHYAMVTAMDKFEIETVIGFNVRRAYLRQDWLVLADMIRYPIKINDTELADKDAFLGYMVDKRVADSDWDVMNEEECLDMFVNGEGICMGSGQVWLNDASYMTDKEPKLEIIAISGIEKGPETIAPESAEKKKEETVTAYDENGNVYTLYEGTDGYWRDKEGTAYIRHSDTDFQVKDGNKHLSTKAPSKEDKDDDDDDDDGVNTERDFYATASVTVYDENGETHKLYEGSDGNWRAEDGTTYVRISQSEYQVKDGNKRVYVR